MIESTYMVFVAGFMLLIPTLVGYLFGFGALKHMLHARTHTVLAFALGVYGVIGWSLASESLEHLGMLPVACGILLTMASMEILKRSLKNEHHHHHADHDHTHDKKDGRAILLSDGVHNVADGLVLVPAFAISPIIGFATTASIFVHELILETAKYFILREAGYTNKEAITRAFVVGTTVFIGIGIALMISSVEFLEPWILTVATGSVLYVIVRDLVPDVFFHTSHHEDWRKVACALFLGAILLLVVQTVLPE